MDGFAIATGMFALLDKHRYALTSLHNVQRSDHGMAEINEVTGDNETIELTAVVISAYVANNPVPASELPALIEQVHQSLSGLKAGAPTAPEATPKPAVNPKRSVHDDYIVCLEDGKKFKSLKRHLATYHGMTPDEYRAKWNLPADYPMVAPGYSAARSALAKTMGLGRKRETPAPITRGRKKA